MIKRIFVLLVLTYCCYSMLIYAYSAKSEEKPNSIALAGFAIWQSKNCQACHQLYGLGGYLGPDLTNIISDSTKGALYAASFIRTGTDKMPNFNFTDPEVDKLIAFLSWVDKSGKTIVPQTNVTWVGNYKLESK